MNDFFDRLNGILPIVASHQIAKTLNSSKMVTIVKVIESQT